MKNFNAVPLQIDDALHNIGEADIQAQYAEFKNRNYAQKLKTWLMVLSENLQTIIIWGLFLYVPAYFLLLILGLATMISMFSIYYLFSYAGLIAIFVLINREKNPLEQR